MYLGPSPTSKGFRFYDPATRKIFESRDVIWYDCTPFYAKEPDSQKDVSLASEIDPLAVEQDHEEPESEYSISKPITSPQILPLGSPIVNPIPIAV